jgi:hypothetical protein
MNDRQYLFFDSSEDSWVPTERPLECSASEVDCGLLEDGENRESIPV